MEKEKGYKYPNIKISIFMFSFYCLKYVLLLKKPFRGILLTILLFLTTFSGIKITQIAKI